MNRALRLPISVVLRVYKVYQNRRVFPLTVYLLIILRRPAFPSMETAGNRDQRTAPTTQPRSPGFESISVGKERIEFISRSGWSGWLRCGFNRRDIR